MFIQAREKTNKDERGYCLWQISLPARLQVEWPPGSGGGRRTAALRGLRHRDDWEWRHCGEKYDECVLSKVSSEPNASNPLSVIYWRLLSFRIVIMSDQRTFMESCAFPADFPRCLCELYLSAPPSSYRLWESLSPYLVSAGRWSVPREPWGRCSARTTEWVCV